jgi:hypothetical protein
VWESPAVALVHLELFQFAEGIEHVLLQELMELLLNLLMPLMASGALDKQIWKE